MKLGLYAGVALVAACSAAFGQTPAIRKVTNAASYAATGLPGAGVAQGAIMYIEGSNLGPAAIQVAGAPRPTSAGLAGTRVRVTVGATNFDAPMIYTLAGQVSAIMPSNVPLGAANVSVIYNGQTSSPFPVQVVRAAFGIFTLNSAGTGPGVLTNANYQPIVFNNTLNVGEGAIIWGTGLGGINTSDAEGAPGGDLPTEVEIFVGGVRVTPLYKGRAPGFTGLDQINFVVPDVEGCAVPIAIRVAGGTGVVSNVVSTSISRSGRVCQDRGFTAADFERAASGSISIGAVTLDRSVSKLNFQGIEATQRADTASGGFYRFDYNNLIRSSTVAEPPPGACTIFTFAGESQGEDPVLSTITPLDAGAALTLNGPKGQKTVNRVQPGTYFAELGGGMTVPGVPGIPGGQPDYLDAGQYTLTGPGGAVVGAFSVQSNLPNPLNWSNESSITNVPRTQELAITWSGGTANDLVVITGLSVRQNPTAGALFLCYERAQAGRFNVPAWVLSALPATGSGGFGTLSVGSTAANPTRFTAPGIDIGVFTYSSSNSKTVNYQ